MPQRPGRPCAQPGCAALVQSGAYCTKHQPIVHDERPTAHERGYGARWRKLRARYLAAHPTCVDPFRLHAGQVRVATDVDHIKPRVEGGSDRDDNLQSLCHSCHSHKTIMQTKFGRADQISRG